MYSYKDEKVDNFCNFSSQEEDSSNIANWIDLPNRIWKRNTSNHLPVHHSYETSDDEDYDDEEKE